MNGIDSKFRLAILVARRAKQLVGGGRRRVDIKSDNPLTIAMEEFRQGKIDFDVLNEEESLFAQEADAILGTVEPVAAASTGEETDDESDLGAEETEEEEAEPESES